jgi:hypothetical protein
MEWILEWEDECHDAGEKDPSFRETSVPNRYSDDGGLLRFFLMSHQRGRSAGTG